MSKCRTIFLAFTIFASVGAFAQDADRKHSIGLYQNTTDYNISLLDNKLVAFDSALSHSFRVAYQRRLSRSWMLNTGLSNGFILNQNIQESFVKKAYAIGWDAAIVLKMNNGRMLKENPRVAPFLSFGYRTDYVPSLKKLDEQPWLFHNQYGAGLNIKLIDRTHIQVQVAVDQKLQGDFNTNIQYRFGLTQSLGKYDEVKPIKHPNLDSDSDGIVDSKDDCPHIFGMTKNNGCPDTLSHLVKKAEEDSLKLLVSEQTTKIEQLELAKEKLQTRNETLAKSTMSSEREQELLLQISIIEDLHKNEIAELVNDRTNTHSDSVVIVDTIYQKEIVYKDNPDKILLLDEIKQLKLSKKDLENELLAETNKTRVTDTVYKTKIIYKDQVVSTIDSVALALLARQKQELERKLEIDRIAKEEAELQAQKVNKKTKVNVNTAIPKHKNYYVITMSSPNITTAESWLRKMKKDFSTARILPQSNGYYRVGVFVAKDYDLAIEILERVKQLSYKSAWLSVE
ncbi:MAG: hypothetical protein COA58_03700 [Bacteroidetes bacterium]|nr:MAG: hypothetical protein COA58_03700 [Bacteroidota bacterium]